MASKKRWECLLYACYWLLLAGCSRVFFPTSPKGAHFHVVFFLILCFLSLIEFFFPASQRPHGLTFRVARTVVAFIFYAILAILILQMTIAGLVVFYLVWPTALKTVLSLEMLILIISVLIVVKDKSLRPYARATFRTIVFFNCVIYIPLYAWLWHPPSASECERIVNPGVVSRQTPQSFPRNLSYPYNVRYAPDKRIVFASFKMAGNLILGFWDKPSANRVIAIDVSENAKHPLGVLRIGGGLMPENFEYNQEKGEMLVTYIGFGKQSIGLIGMNDFPKLRLLRIRNVDYEPNGIAMMPGGREFSVVSIDHVLVFYNYSDFRELYRTVLIPSLSQKISEGLSLLHVWHTPGTPFFYLSSVGPMLAEYNMETKKMRLAKVVFGGGDLVAVPESQTIYQTDILSGSLNVVDAKSMTLKKRIRLGYTPRAVQADFGRDIVMVGDWFRGTINLYRASTLNRIVPPVPVGSYLRDFDYDAERGLLFSASKCGVYQTDIDKIIKRAEP